MLDMYHFNIGLICLTICTPQAAFNTIRYSIVGDAKSVSYFEIKDSSVGDVTIARDLAEDPDLTYVVSEKDSKNMYIMSC